MMPLVIAFWIWATVMVIAAAYFFVILPVMLTCQAIGDWLDDRTRGVPELDRLIAEAPGCMVPESGITRCRGCRTTQCHLDGTDAALDDEDEG